MLKPILGGFGLGLLLLACGGSQLIECRLSAIQALPDDPGQITPYDTLDLIHRLKACRVQGDAGP